jgi:hypothetical protein
MHLQPPTNQPPVAGLSGCEAAKEKRGKTCLALDAAKGGLIAAQAGRVGIHQAFPPPSAVPLLTCTPATHAHEVPGSHVVGACLTLGISLRQQQTGGALWDGSSCDLGPTSPRFTARYIPCCKITDIEFLWDLIPRTYIRWTVTTHRDFRLPRKNNEKNSTQTQDRTPESCESTRLSHPAAAMSHPAPEPELAPSPPPADVGTAS